MTGKTVAYYLIAFGFGLIFGSFFNVCIYRIPLEKGLGGRSRCPDCGADIKWYDNIPLVSFAVLRGKCRRCGLRISWRYPLIELSSGLLFVLAYWWSRNIVPAELGIKGKPVIIPELFIGLLLFSVLLISTAVDIEHGIVPNLAMYPGLIMMLALVTGIALYRGQPGRIGLSVAAAFTGGGFLLVAGLLYGALFMKKLPLKGEEVSGEQGEGGAARVKEDGAQGEQIELSRISYRGGSEKIAGELEEFMAREEDDLQAAGGEDGDEIRTGIGMGDVKLLALVGLALGYFHWYLILVAIFLGFLLGSVVAIVLMILHRMGRKDRLPFAPFLAAGSVLALVWGAQLVSYYIGLFA